MKHALHMAFLKALSLALIASIVGVGVFAVRLTHVHASFTVTFGDQTTAAEVELADAMPPANIPYPMHKPQVPHGH